MNWPKGIILVFILFASGIGFLVYKTTEKQSEMVAENYYEKELKYQDVIDGKDNAARLSARPTAALEEGRLVVQFPADFIPGNVSGKVYFYRASDVKKDVTVPLVLDSLNRQFISADRFSTGTYQAQFSWTANDTTYFSEQNLYIP